MEKELTEARRAWNFSSSWNQAGNSELPLSLASSILDLICLSLSISSFSTVSLLCWAARSSSRSIEVFVFGRSGTGSRWPGLLAKKYYFN